jgi:hypothetical protein
MQSHTKHKFRTCLPSIPQLALELLLNILDEMPLADQVDSARPGQCHRCFGGRIPAISATALACCESTTRYKEHDCES